MAAALESGRLGVMDYYRLNNIQADTQMSRTIDEVSPEGVTAEGADKPANK